jgi:hypothetical protein
VFNPLAGQNKIKQKDLQVRNILVISGNCIWLEGRHKMEVTKNVAGEISRESCKSRLGFNLKAVEHH